MTFVTICNGKDKDYKVNDDIMTPEHIAKMLIGKIKPFIKEKDSLYDPFKGKGSFFNNFPKQNLSWWSEIKEGKDFFDCDGKVDWIISNPPYSKFTEVMKKSYEVADNICYLIPLNKIVSSWGRVLDMETYGGVVKIWILQASKCGFPFGFPACFCWIKRGYKGSIDVEIIKELRDEKSS